MKTNYTNSNYITGLLLLVGFLVSIKTLAQPDYDFRNHSLLSGTDRQVGAVYLFPTVKPGVDAIMTITHISPGITVTEMDGSSGFPEALQPTLVADPLANGYLEMHFEFVVAGTSTPFIQNEVPVTCIDVDGWADNDGLGNPLQEFDEVDLGGGYVDYQLTGGELAMSQSGTWFNGKNVGGIDYPGRDTAARQVMFTAVNGNISQLTIRVGVHNSSTVSGNRLRSVYFKKFVYPNSILAKSSLMYFQGSQRNNAIELQWKLENENNINSVVIEKGDGNSFVALSQPDLDRKNPNSLYTFRDSDAFNDKIYYRLRLISVSGTVQYSNVLMFYAGDVQSAFKVFPSIIQSSATLQVTSQETATAIFRVLDYSGRVVLQKNINVQEGINNVVVTDLDRFHRGNYIAVIKITDKIYSQKIFKP